MKFSTIFAASAALLMTSVAVNAAQFAALIGNVQVTGDGCD